LAFYKRNYIEGLFLSSGIIRSPNYTMEQIVEVARSLREDHDFRGYIHLKTIPDADPELVRLAGIHADRVSINIELPTAQGLAKLAPEKSVERIEGAMGAVKTDIDMARDETARFKSAPHFAPAGQSTQMIVGADSASDSDIVARSSKLYDRFGLRRVYYSAFSPIPDASAVLPLKRPPLMREHRLYQSDWLMRFYGFTAPEVADAADEKGMLPLDMDPKLAWALKFRGAFPVDVNRAPREQLLRVPGLGTKAIDRILASRRLRRLRLEDVARLTVSLVKVRPFIVAADWRPTLLTDRGDLRALVAPPRQQLELFAA
ncbi:MAG TPA: putative DNA modification/repair radical SAM protein, partial [Sphingomicrobium sp.]|nr:putative DNA modification/repair radical SAM protein [Sphingomicrobium sp.]